MKLKKRRIFKFHITKSYKFYKKKTFLKSVYIFKNKSSINIHFILFNIDNEQ